MSLGQFPDEIIQHLLLYLPPEDNLVTFQHLSRRMSRIAREPLLWRHHCRARFLHWDARHGFFAKLSGRASATDWMGLFIARLRRNARAARLLDQIINSGPGDPESYGDLAQLGCDVKDFLLEQSRIDDAALDVLARRYHSSAILDSIHRSIALGEWQKLQRIHLNPKVSPSVRAQEPGLRLERILGAFDMFVLHDQLGDIDHISALLDDVAANFRNDNPRAGGLSTRQKALVLNSWLRLHGLVGIGEPDVNYRNLRNCFLGQALRHEHHESLPIISCAIYSCVAERLGLDARCCLFPNHVHIVVYARPDETLDGRPCARPHIPTRQVHRKESMFLDPYGRDDEVPLAELQRRLASYRLLPLEKYLSAAPPSMIARRAASNIYVAAEAGMNTAVPSLEALRLLGPHNPMNHHDATYAARWATLMMTTPAEFDTLEWNQHARLIMDFVNQRCPGDRWLVDKYLVPLYHRLRVLAPQHQQDHHQQHHQPRRAMGYQPDDFHRIVHAPGSWQPSPAKRLDRLFLRNTPETRSLKFKVGQVVRHRRYNWISVITGWGIRYAAKDRPKRDAQTPSHVAYYSILRSDTFEPWLVVQESVQLVRDPVLVSDVLLAMAGKYFRRFDAVSCTFVSNVKRQYPDD